MGYDVKQHQVVQFAKNVEHIAQQKDTVIDKYVTKEKMFVGKSFTIDTVGSTHMVKKTAKFNDTPMIATPLMRRQGTAQTFQWGEMIDSEEELMQIHNINSEYTTAAAFALNRMKDDIIIMSAFADVREGEEGENTVAFPTKNILTETGTDPLTLDKLLEIRQMIAETDVAFEQGAWEAFISPNDATALLTDDKLQSQDYNTVRALVDGQATDFMGFHFNSTNRLQMDTTRKMYKTIFCLPSKCFVKGIQKNLTIRADPRVDKSYATQLFMETMRGCVRADDAYIVQLETYDARIGDTINEVTRNGEAFKGVTA